MANTISSRTPEGVPNHCPVCAAAVCIEPSQPLGDAPCPNCGTLLWFFNTSAGVRFYESAALAPLRNLLFQSLHDNLGVTREQITDQLSLQHDMGADSLDLVELVMEMEETFAVTIPDAEAENLKTVGDVLDYLAKRIL